MNARFVLDYCAIQIHSPIAGNPCFAEIYVAFGREFYVIQVDWVAYD